MKKLILDSLYSVATFFKKSLKKVAKSRKKVASRKSHVSVAPTLYIYGEIFK